MSKGPYHVIESNMLPKLVKLTNTKLKRPCKASLENEKEKINENGRIDLKGPSQEKKWNNATK